jgi:carbon monoxide dehydrogenase subunit G
VKLAGAFQVTAPSDGVYGFLTDWSRVAPILPDVRSFEVPDPDTVTLRARVGVSAIRGTMRTRLTIVDREPVRRAHYRGRANGLGSSVDLEMAFELEPAPGGTEVRWWGTATIGGRLTLAGSLLEPFAKRQLEVFVDAVRAALGRERVLR